MRALPRYYGNWKLCLCNFTLGSDFMSLLWGWRLWIVASLLRSKFTLFKQLLTIIFSLQVVDSRPEESTDALNGSEEKPGTETEGQTEAVGAKSPAGEKSEDTQVATEEPPKSEEVNWGKHSALWWTELHAEQDGTGISGPYLWNENCAVSK